MIKQQVLIPSVMSSNLTGAISRELEYSEVCGWYEPTLQVYFKLKIANHAKVPQYGQGKLTDQVPISYIVLSAHCPNLFFKQIFNEITKTLI